MSDKAPSQALEPEPMTRGPLAALLFLGAVVTTSLVALWLMLDVNRVFDVPKALALKAGGGGIFLVWLLYGLFGRGHPWKSLRLFAGPVFLLAAVVVVSALLSIDVPMSFYGVYERQFGVQGFLGCVGIFAATATSLRSRRGAVVGFAVLAVLGGMIGTYALLQSRGADPLGFFREEHLKVYSFLGNATFAGNALALIAPMSALLALVAGTRTLARDRWDGRPVLGWLAFVAGFAGLLFLEIAPGFWLDAQSGMATDQKRTLYRIGLFLSGGLVASLGAVGSWGLRGFGLGTERARRAADAAGAGALAACVVGIALGLLFTRTRGAWVGTSVAIFAGLLLLPLLFSDEPARMKRMFAACLAALLIVGGVITFYLFSYREICEPRSRCWIYARTIWSIPAAFDPDRKDFGKGQGTRRYLWSESPRVLTRHTETLDRQLKDRTDRALGVHPKEAEDLSLARTEPPAEGERAFTHAWRRVSVWLFGIGIETYRYAFMSHKSKRLEALDPMTNHDNPHNNYLYVLASCGVAGLAAYLWLLTRLLGVSFRRFSRLHEGDTRADRALAFGVVTSFFSYAVYSIAGFDSVACSVFFFFLLGCAAAYFEPNGDEPARALGVNVKRHLASLRGRDPSDVPNQPPMIPSLAAAAIGVMLLVHTIHGAWTVYRAERAFVGSDEPARTRAEYAKQQLDGIKEAIRINPYESYYKLELGNTYARMVRLLLTQEKKFEEKGDKERAEQSRQRAQDLAESAETVYYAALDHAWAPENVFISLFQFYYSLGDLEAAERALERALEHSPHLAAVRANLAALEIERGAYEEAIADCEWVLEIDRKNALALRACGRAHLSLGRLDEAERHLDLARRVDPKDEAIRRYLDELEEKRRAAATSSSS